MKLLTILNTIAIVILFYFGFQTGIFDTSVESEEIVDEVIEETENEPEEIEAEQEEMEEEEEGTLSLDDYLMPNGFVDLTGYMTTETVFLFGQNVDQAYFAFNESSDEDIKTFITEQVTIGNSLNRKIGSTYYLGLGCDTGEAIDNLNFDVTGDNYWTLRGSKSTNPITLRAFFNNSVEGGLGGTCLSHAETIQVVDEV